MTISIYLVPLVMLAGALMYFLAKNGKVAEVGRIMFAMALLVFLMSQGGKLLHF